MRVTSKNHDGIIVIEVLPEKGDDAAACLWMRVYLDPEHGQMLSDSDIGNYAHRWPENGKRFLKLMSSVGDSYVMEKCCHDQKEYDADSIVEDINDYFSDIDEWENESDKEDCRNFLDELSYCSSVFDIDRVFHDTAFDYGDAWECIRKSYTPWQKRWAEYFYKYVEPEVRKWIPLWEDDADEV